MYLETATAGDLRARARVEAFLKRQDLRFDAGADYTVSLVEDGEIVATASLDGATVKCVAVEPSRRGEDLSAQLMTRLRQEAFRRGVRNLMLFTRPQNRAMFEGLGFHALAQTMDCLLMESARSGLADFLAALERPAENIETGCVVANCNPVTNGHLHLIREAARRCAALHLFILSEEAGPIPAADRLSLVREACAGMEKIYVHASGPYMVSAATFPDYFLKERARADDVRCALDVRLFAARIAPALNIRRRFVGTEPYCAVTRAYNERMKIELPRRGVELIELARLESDGEAVSASRVRALWRAGDVEALRPLVPECSYRYLRDRKYP